MKIKLNKNKFEEILESLSRGMQSNSPFPALQGILLRVSESNLQIIVSNGNLSIKETIEKGDIFSVEEPGEALIPGTLFKGVVKKQSKEFEIKTNDKTAEITSEGSKMFIQLMNSKDYPTISFDSIGKTLIIDSEALNSLIKNVAFAASENDKRIILNGVNLEAKDGQVTATATNSFRVAQETVEVDSNVDFNITILSKNLKDFLPKKVKGPINISVNDSKIITRTSSSINVSKLIDGVYPNISSLIPSDFKNKLKINSKLFCNLMDKATVVSDEGNKVIKINMTKDRMTIESKKREMGNSVVETNDFNWEGDDDYNIAINAQFLKEAASKFEGIIQVYFNGPLEPVVIKGDPSNGKILQLVLPHRSY